MSKVLNVGLVSLVSVFALSACAPNIGANNYETNQTQQVTQVQMGKIISESQVQVSGGPEGNNLVGTVGGAAAGGVAGSMIGQGSGSTLAAIGGAVIGGLAGNYAEKKITSQTATRYVIQLNSGGTVAVVQADNPPIPVGTRVQVISGNPAQVVVDNSTAAAPTVKQSS